MKHHRHFNRTGVAAVTEAAQIGTLINDLSQIVKLLECGIATEEESARTPDPRNIAYPIVARAMATRRDNLKATIAALESRLADLRSQTSPQRPDDLKKNPPPASRRYKLLQSFRRCNQSETLSPRMAETSVTTHATLGPRKFWAEKQRLS